MIDIDQLNNIDIYVYYKKMIYFEMFANALNIC